MKKLALVVLAGLAVAGCTPPATVMGPANTVQAKDLAVSVNVPKQFYSVGERVKATVTAANLTDKPLTIPARTGAPVYIHLTRYTGLFEEEFRTYPQSAIMRMSAWTLAPRETKTFVLDLPIEPDWPQGEALHLAAELNGRADLQPVVVITVLSRARPAAPPTEAPAAETSPTPASKAASQPTVMPATMSSP